MINQQIIKKLHTTTLAEIKTTRGSQGTLSVCDEQSTIYHYEENGAAYTPNDEDILTTGDGGDSRWLGISGQYGLHDVLVRSGTTLSPKNTGDDLDMGAGNVVSTGQLGRDTDNNIGFGTDNQIDITVNGNTTSVQGIAQGSSGNNQLITKGYADEGFERHKFHVITVAQSGADFTSIKAAMDSIVGNGPTSRWVVLVSPGLYYEDPMTFKEYVDVVGMGGPLQTSIIANNSAAPLITFSGTGTFKNFTLSGTTTSSLMLMSVGSKTQMIEYVFCYNAQYGLNVTNGYVLVNQLNELAVPATSITSLLRMTNLGTGTIKAIGSADGASSVNVMDIDGASVHATIHGGRIASSAAIGIKINDAHVELVDVTVINAAVGLDMDGACDVSADTLHMDATTLLHLNIRSLSVILKLAGGEIDRNSYNAPVGYQGETAQFIDSSDRTVLVWGDMSIGRPTNPRVLSTGDGRGHNSGIKVYTTDDTATSTTDGGNLIDVTPEAQSGSGSTFSFQGVGANHTILMAATYEDASDKLKITALRMLQTIAAVGGSFVIEFWDGAAWSQCGMFAVSRDELYRYANNVFLRANSDEFIFISTYPTWTKKTISGIEAYWIRVRISTSVTTAPVFEQMFVHHNSSKFTIKGQQMFLGEAKFKMELSAGGNIFGEVGGVVDGSAAVGIGTGNTGWTHEMKSSRVNSANDGVCYQGSIPKGFCTACPIQIRASVRGVDVSDPTGTDAQFIFKLIPLSQSSILVADPSGGKVPVPRPLSSVEQWNSKAAFYDTINVVADDTSYNKSQLIESGYFDISNYYEGDLILLEIEVLDQGSESQDFDVVYIEVIGAKWTHGERI